MRYALSRGGILAELSTSEELVRAIGVVRDAGLTRLDAFTPYPVHAVEHALALRPSRLPQLSFLFGLVGALFAYGLQYWTSAVDYPVNIGGFSPHSGPAFIPITFETVVLFSSLGAVIAFLVACRLPRLWHPVFEVDAFSSAAIDAFWLAIDASDPKFDRERLISLLTNVGARVHRLPEVSA